MNRMWLSLVGYVEMYILFVFWLRWTITWSGMEIELIGMEMWSLGSWEAMASEVYHLLLRFTPGKAISFSFMINTLKISF